MVDILETEVNTHSGNAPTDRLTQVMEVLPFIRRWLDSSAPQPSQMGAGAAQPSLSQVRIMVHLYQHGPQTMSQLAAALGISNSTATEGVTGLAQIGRVVRARSDTDRRQVVVRLTPEAEAIASDVQSRRRLILERVLSGLSASESRAFIKGVRLLAEEAQSWLESSSSQATQTHQGSPSPVS